MAGESARELSQRQREKAERLLQAAERNERGADGEERTARVLERLPSDGWTQIHDVRWPGRQFANVDHVVVGPGGVFVIDSKNWSGRVTIAEGSLRCSGYKKDREVDSAAEVALAVAALTDAVRVDQVKPVLCFVKDEPLAGWARDVMVCSTANLLSMLESRPTVLTPAQVRDASLQLDAQLSPANGRSGWKVRPTGTVAPSDRRRRASRPVSRRDARSRGRRRDTSVPRLVVGLAIIGVLIFAPGVVVAASQVLVQLFMSTVNSPSGN